MGAIYNTDKLWEHDFNSYLMTFKFSNPIFRQSPLLLLFVLIFCLYSSPTVAQTPERQMGAFLPQANDPLSPDGADLVDQFGKTYQWQDLMVDLSPENARVNSGCQTGTFNLCFTGFDPDEEATICDAFNYLSGFVSVGPEGSVPLVQVVKEGFTDPVTGQADNSTVGVAIVYWRLECGLINPLMFDVMNSSFGQSLPQGFASAVIRINGNLDWHTLADDPMPAQSSSFDLYSVALHEAIHTLGFASRLGENNINTTPTIFSRWDRFLWSDNLNDFVLTPAQNPEPGCCDQMEFNPDFTIPTGSNFPPDLLTGCLGNVFFRVGGNNLAQVNGTYPGPPNTTTINNIFSHLDRCGAAGPNYVMNSSIAAGEVRRILDQAESAILAALGYVVPGSSDEPCNIIAVDDLINTTQGDPNISINPTLPNNLLIANDLAPAGATITFDQDCGTAFAVGLANIITNGNLSITPWRANVTAGTYTVCYTVTGCDGQCDDGVLVINLAPNVPQFPECSAPDACSGEPVWCHGDFQDMFPALHSAQSQIGVIDCFGGSPDGAIDLSNGNRYVRLFNEAIVIPLVPGVAPGCAIEVNMDGYGGTINLSAGEEAPCENTTAGGCPGAPNGTYDCVGTLSFQSPGSFPHGSCTCSDPQIQQWIPNCNFSGSLVCNQGPIPFAPVTTGLVANNSSQTWNYLYISGVGLPGPKLIDNLEILAHCENELELTTNEELPDTVCPGEISTVNVRVCMTGSNTNSSDVTVNVDLPFIPGVSIVPGSDFDGGSATITGMAPGDCRILTVAVEVGFNIPPGTTIPVDLEMEGTNVCIHPNSLTSYEIYVDSCDTDTNTCFAEWEIRCFSEHNYFCVVNEFGGSDHIQWVSPAFPADPNGHCQSLTGLTPGQPLTFWIFVYEEGILACTLEVNTTLPCEQKGGEGGEHGGGGNLGGDDGGKGGRLIPGQGIDMDVFPNPATNQVTVRFDAEIRGEGMIWLFDAQGRKVLEKPISISEGTNENQLQLDELPAGIYAVSLVGPDKQVRGNTRLIRVE